MKNNAVEKINDLAVKLISEAKYNEAEEALQQLIHDYPKFTPGYYNLANLYFMQEKLSLALKFFQKVIEMNSDHAKSYLAIAMILETFSHYAQALGYYEKAYKIDPNLPNAKTNLCHMALHNCDWENLKKYQQQLFKLDIDRLKNNLPPEQSPFQSLILFPDPMINLLVARGVSKEIKKAVFADFKQNQAFEFANRLGKKGKIKIGYLSADFYNHPTAYLLENFFALHNRQKFKVFAYSYGPDDHGSFRQKIMDNVDKFVDISQQNDFEAAKQIYQDQIDILVDLKGHTQHSRLGIAAFKPAPIQVTYLGFPGSTGADFFDYLIADRTIIPEEEQIYYSEKIAYLPNSYQINCRSPLPNTRKNKHLSLPKNKFIYAFLGRSYKIDETAFASWMKILRTVKNSVLWLLDSNPQATANLIRAAQAQGIAANRLIFAPLVENQIHLKRLQAANLCLDSWVYGGHTTTSDALYAGTPVLSRYGNHFASRVSASLLKAADLPELVTYSSEEYEQQAIKLGLDKIYFRKIKHKLRQNLRTCALFNQPLSVVNLEKIYTSVWQNYQLTHSLKKPKRTLIFNVTKNPKKARTWPKQSITFILGPQLDSWDPNDLTNANSVHIGGSEEAVIFLTQELNKLGYDITVFGQPKQAKMYQKIRWLNFTQLNPDDRFETVIFWRSPELVTLNLPAKKKYLWLHDVTYSEQLPLKTVKQLTKILVLSKAHRRLLNNIPNEKILVTQNGFYEHSPKIKPKNNPYNCLWTSSYDRGLDYLLKMWPKVLKAVPKACLHIFYGWQAYDQINVNHPPAKKFKAKVIKLLKQPGVINHGRVNQIEMEKWYKQGGLLVYPTNFYEISCISAMKAQAFGCVPVVSDFAALSETVRYGLKIKGDMAKLSTQKQFFQKLIYALKHPQWQQNQRQLMIPWAKKKFSWKRVAKQWHKEISC